MQRHGAFVIIAESRALQARRAAERKAKEAGEKYERPKGEPTTHQMEENPDHYFVHAVDSRLDGIRMVEELRKAKEFSGGKVDYHKTTDVGEEMFKGNDVIAGLQKMIGKVGLSGEASETNNIMLVVARRALIDAM